MDKYLEEVRQNLTGLPQNDADDLLEYYQEFFLDAGLSPDEVESKYGKPKKFAQALKMTYFLEQDDHYDQQVQGEPDQASDDLPINQDQAPGTASPTSKSQNLPAPYYPRTKNRVRLVWLIVLGLFASPILLPVAVVILIAVLLAFATLLMILLAGYAAALTAVVVGLVSLVSGLGVMLPHFASGLFFLGFGILLVGAGIMLAPLTWKLTRLLFSGLVFLVKKIGRKASNRRLAKLKGVDR